MNDEPIKNPDEYLSDEIRELLKPKEDVSEKSPKTIEKEEHLKKGLEYWSKIDPKFITTYEKGEIISNYNSVSEYDHLNLFHSLSRLFYELLREEMVKKEIEISTLKECFIVIDSAFRVLSKQIDMELTKDQEDPNMKLETIDVDLLFSAVHGFINSYVERKSVD